MSANAARARATDEASGLTRRALGTTFDLVRDVLTDPSILEGIPEDATLVLVPTDDDELAAAEVEQGLAALRRGEDVYFRHVRARKD